MRGALRMTNDDFAALRTYARGFLAGSSTATLDESMAYRREAVAVVALRELGYLRRRKDHPSAGAP